VARVVSKEQSGLLLTADGRWLHEGEPATHAGIKRFFHHQIRRDERGEYYLYNSIVVPNRGRLEEHVYFEREGTAYFVERLTVDHARGVLAVELNTGSHELVDPATLSSDDDGRVYCRLAAGDEALLGRHAIMQLEPALERLDDGVGLRVGDRLHVIGQHHPRRPRRPGSAG
jgi:hypothetical protein